MMRTCTHCSAPVAPRARYCDDCRDTAAPWRPDDVAIELAAEHLGLAFPVRVRRSAGRGLGGRYHGPRLNVRVPNDLDVILRIGAAALPDHMHHRITIAARQTPEAASRSIWHEITHALQFERDPIGFPRRYAAEMAIARRLTRRGVPIAAAYRGISFEREAKANEDLHYSLLPLTRANRRAGMRPLQRPHPRVHSVVDGRIVPGSRAATIEEQVRRDISAAKGRRV